MENIILKKNTVNQKNIHKITMKINRIKKNTWNKFGKKNCSFLNHSF